MKTIVAWLGNGVWFGVALLPACLVGQEPVPRVGLDLLECIKITLSEEPNIQIQKELVRQSQGAWQSQSGAFDYQLSASAGGGEERTPVSAAVGAQSMADMRVNGTLFYAGEVAKMFRSGLEASASLQVNRNDSHDAGVTIKSNGSLNIDLRVPLLKDRGKAVITAGETASNLGYQASESELDFTVSLRLLATINAYWLYLDSVKSLEVFQRSEAWSERLVKDTQTLIEADELPKNELLQLQADLAAKKSARVSAASAVFEARHRLGLAMGLEPRYIAELPLPATEFPDIESYHPPGPEVLEALVGSSLGKRPDYLAARLRAEAASVNLTVARNDLKPALDLKLGTGYNSLGEGSGIDKYFGALADEVPGLNFTASLSYQFAPKNNAARGRFSQSHAQLVRNNLETADLSRNIRVRVALALENLRSGYFALKAAAESQRLFELAVANERKKFQLGFSTLIDLLNFQDRLNNVKLTYISNERQFMEALAQLRFETGFLSLEQSEIDHLNEDFFQAFPQP